jgi:hypothetical protein
MWIVFLDLIDLPLSPPLLHCFLALNGKMNVSKVVVPNQPMNAILFGEAFDHTILVLGNPAKQIATHANVECSIWLACKDVDRVQLILIHPSTFCHSPTLVIPALVAGIYCSVGADTWNLRQTPQNIAI